MNEVVGVVTSPWARRLVVNTVVLLAGASTLLVPASIATALFFQNYVPHQVLSKPVYLQYGYAVSCEPRVEPLYYGKNP